MDNELHNRWKNDLIFYGITLPIILYIIIEVMA
jgi:hypothetical protein